MPHRHRSFPVLGHVLRPSWTAGAASPSSGTAQSSFLSDCPLTSAFVSENTNLILKLLAIFSLAVTGIVVGVTGLHLLEPKPEWFANDPDPHRQNHVGLGEGRRVHYSYLRRAFLLRWTGVGEYYQVSFPSGADIVLKPTSASSR